MNLAYSEEQEMLRSELGKLLRDLKNAGSDAAVQWHALAELGSFGLLGPAERGGIGGSLIDAGLLMEQIGEHDAAPSVLTTAVLPSRLLALTSGADSLFSELLEGRARICLALIDADGGVRAHGGGGGYRLSGAKKHVHGVEMATHIIVTAGSLNGESRLFLVEVGAPGISQVGVRSLDGSSISSISLMDVAAEPLQVAGKAQDALEAAVDESIIIGGAEAMGAMSAAIRQTASYANQRRQFGKPIGSFQVVQHKLAEMAVCREEARAIVLLASLRASESPEQRRKLASAVKVKVGECARLIAQSGVQLHGGMGVSEETPIASYFRRLSSFQYRLGSAAHHRRRYAQDCVRPGVHHRTAVLPETSMAEEEAE